MNSLSEMNRNDANGFPLWKKVVAGMMAGGECTLFCGIARVQFLKVTSGFEDIFLIVSLKNFAFFVLTAALRLLQYLQVMSGFADFVLIVKSLAFFGLAGSGGVSRYLFAALRAGQFLPVISGFADLIVITGFLSGWVKVSTSTFLRHCAWESFLRVILVITAIKLFKYTNIC
jgi:hypothetical protein